MSTTVPVPSDEQILAALDRTGYMFEQRVANLLGSDVSTGWAFKDQDTGASREVDIYKSGSVYFTARDKGKQFSIRWIIVGECKNYQWPWVALTKPWDGHYSYREWPELALSVAARVELGIHDFAFDGPEDTFNHAYHVSRFAMHTRAVQLVKLNKKSGGWEAHSGDIFNELTYPLAKATSFLKSRFTFEHDTDSRIHGERERVVTLIFPSIFLSSDIYAVSASDSQPQVTSERHVILERQLSSESISGLYRYDVVNVDGIAEWYNGHVLGTVKSVIDAAGLGGRRISYSRSFKELPSKA
ncbi:hypothetical protein GA0074695_1194 [Micromonospora viridifaciens]|uniref:Uncharacterized protein n=1 Tax=Micromonospora viridifaciens TaxID=1881 RepID=A0A1C4V757_MICVI|nr:hypothetical protein [Micromonospora viridifaciens]SCE79671.1 hypothetical protein GA0074695_1194 [Micromonospora viridifaciens]